MCLEGEYHGKLTLLKRFRSVSYRYGKLTGNDESKLDELMYMERVLVDLIRVLLVTERAFGTEISEKYAYFRLHGDSLYGLISHSVCYFTLFIRICQ